MLEFTPELAGLKIRLIPPHYQANQHKHHPGFALKCFAASAKMIKTRLKFKKWKIKLVDEINWKIRMSTTFQRFVPLIHVNVSCLNFS